MSRLEVTPTAKAERTVRSLYDSLSHRISASPVGNCPVELTSAFLKLCLAQSCGKCRYAPFAELVDETFALRGKVIFLAYQWDIPGTAADLLNTDKSFLRQSGKKGQ